ncbi:MAG: phosphonoacetate hydrolase [Reyranella sp.]
MTKEIHLNDRRYRLPTRPTIVICVDGFDPSYLEQGISGRILPTFERLQIQGFVGIADAVVPTFTNPNNTSIVTGAPPSVHGISGNYYLDRETGREIMVTDAHLLRCETILGLMSQAGVKTAAVTAKDKLRKMLGYNLKGISFSSQFADGCTLEENGIADAEALVGRAKPGMYSPDLSLFVLDAGIRLMERGDARLLYLSLSDWIQHSHAPGERESDEFHRAIDQRVGRMIDLGAVVGVTADHGMNDKAAADGSPNVVFLEDELNARFGDGAVRVICPIADPFVRHHGALGSFVRVYDKKGVGIAELMKAAAGLAGIELVLDGPSAAERFELPLDREADFVAIAARNATIGAKHAEHDLSTVDGHRLRSHGGISEQPVPFIVSEKLNPEYAAIARSRRLRNFDIFDFVLNGTL